MKRRIISNPHKKAIAEAQAKYYRLYHPDLGYIEGYNLQTFCKEHGYRHSDLRKVFYGHLYSSQGFYQSEETYLNKDLWEQQNPLLTSDEPGVSFHRGNQKWFAKVWKKRKMIFSKFYKTEQEAIDAIRKFKKENNLL